MTWDLRLVSRGGWHGLDAEGVLSVDEFERAARTRRTAGGAVRGSQRPETFRPATVRRD